MKITREWLESYGSPCGPRGFAWTRAQVESLGVKWPLKKGWQDKLIGKEITETLAQTFIENRDVLTKRGLKSRYRRQLQIAASGAA